MKNFTIALCLFALLVAPVRAQDSAVNRALLPIAQRPFQPEMRIARFSGGRADECLSSMGQVGPASANADICPLPGNYFALADGVQIAIGGRQNFADVGWKSLQGSYTLLRPSVVVGDADVVAIDGPGRYSNEALFGTSANGFKVLRFDLPAGTQAADLTQTGNVISQVDFAGIMKDLYTEGQNLTATFTAGQTFWDRTHTSSFTARQCGFDKATWYYGGNMRFVMTAHGVTWIMGGNFTDPVLNRCMMDHRWVEVRTLMAAREAADIQAAVRAKRQGQTPFLLEWVSVPGGATYGFWSALSGGIAYYAYVTLNSAKQVMGTTLFIALPDPYEMDCMVQEMNGYKECVIFRTEP